MKTVLVKSQERGHAHHDWLDSYYSFSYGDYHNPQRMHFGALRFLNDNIIAIGKEVYTENQPDEIIINLPLKDSLHFKDSFGNEGMARWGQLLIFNTGRANNKLMYLNRSEHHQVEFLQIGFTPRQIDTSPSHKIVTYLNVLRENEFECIIAPDGTAPASINQNVSISIGEFQHGKTAIYQQRDKSAGIYIFMLGGEARVANQTLSSKDALEVEYASELVFTFSKNSALLIVEIPLQ